MALPRSSARLCGVVLACGSLLAVPALTHAAMAEDPTDGPTVAVRGTLLQVPAEPDSGRVDTLYAVQLAGGDIVPVRADFATPPRPNARLSAELVVPATVQGALADRGVDLDDDATVSQWSAAGRLALALVDRASSTMTLTDAQVTPAVPLPATKTTVHRLRVAVPTNLGTSAGTDASILQAMQKVADYWDDESDGAVDVRVPTEVKRYATSVTGAAGDCGLGGRAGVFDNLVQEGRRQFADFAATDQLVVLVPENGCRGGLGLGYVGGDGFASDETSGGALVATANPAYVVGTVAHEMGHNYGYLHANVGTGEAGSAPYAGIYDVMGYGIAGVNQLPTLSTGYRQTSRIVADGEVEALTSAAGPSTTRTIGARQDESGLRGLAVTDPATGVVYDIDYRSGTGKDKGAAYTAGATPAGYTFGPGIVVSRRYGEDLVGGVVVVPNGTRTATGIGQTWTSPSQDLTVSVLTTTGTSATVVVNFLPAIPVVGAPVVSGAPRVGSVLSADPGSWTPGTTFDYRWESAGRTVGTGTQLTLPAGLAGQAVQLVVTGRLADHRDTSRTSAPVVVGPGQLISSAPKVVGTPRVGRTLQVARGAWSAGAGLSQMWLVGGRPVSGGTALKLTKAMTNKTVAVQVTGRASGYATVTRTSAAVRVRR